MSFPSNIWILFKLLIIWNAVFSITIFGVMLFMPIAVQAMSDAHQQGMSLAQSTSLPQPGNPEKVPGYAGTNLPQSQIKPHDLGEAAQRESQSNEGAQLIAENVEKGSRYVIDPHTDPLILAGNEVVNNPQKTLDDSIVEDEVEERGREEVKAETISCEEAGDEYIQRCTKRLEITFKITPEQIVESRYCPANIYGYYIEGVGGTRPWWCPNLQGQHCSGCMTSNTVIPEKVELVKEQWVDDCTHLEELADKGLCRYQSKTTSSKNETRTIQRQQVKRDHFEEYFEYACLKASGKSCAGLRERGCYQINSVCKETIANTCVLWEQTYRCPAKRIGGKSYRSSHKENPFCLSGDCVDKSYEANQDFAEVMSHMSVLKEAANDFTKFGMIFKGNARKCTRHCTNFKDCCGNGKGWGVSLSLASCDADEKELAQLREKKRCIQVGTYCAEKVLGVCIRKKTSFCCYDTKLAKIIQEQGKGQLGLGFGSPKEPQCQGLTPEQLSRIDFSQINFSDIFSDIVASIKPPNPEKIMSGIQKSMANKGSLLKPSVKVLQEEPKPSSHTQPSVGSRVVSNSGTSGVTKPDVPSILKSPSASAMDDNFDISPEEARIWEQSVQDRTAATIRAEDSRKKSTSAKKVGFGGKSKFSAYDDDFGSTSIYPIPKLDARPNTVSEPRVQPKLSQEEVDNRWKNFAKKGTYGAKSTFSAYDDDFGSIPISPIVKPDARPNTAQNSLIRNEEHVSRTLPESATKSGNQQIQGRNHGEF